ncbi:hypothetical protein E2562_004452 [Oryza meyeriana var. granulata]|uniref:DUF834 domain-containing protein n=1 Tax=Oryza meyeriana var. granulata TaxID=110450 RepID=A0A6G1CZI5_9ORYZ|nr:hypothetical protein E2562_004452 [Oryza meyeriana var. granulata]
MWTSKEGVGREGAGGGQARSRVPGGEVVGLAKRVSSGEDEQQAGMRLSRVEGAGQEGGRVLGGRCRVDRHLARQSSTPTGGDDWDEAPAWRR